MSLAEDFSADLSFTFGFTHPYLDAGDPLSATTPLTHHVAIGGHPYMIDVEKFSFATVPDQRESVQDSGEPGEQTLNPAGYWRRSASRFDLGAGQRLFDLDSEGLTSSRRRWFTSRGIDGMSDPDALQLLPGTEIAGSSTETNLFIVSGGGWNYASFGDQLSGAPIAGGTPEVSTANADITSLATDGTKVYITSVSSPLEVITIAADEATIADLGTLEPDKVFFANGRLFGVEGQTVYEITNAGAKPGGANLFQYPYGTGGRWSAITGSPVGTYLAYVAGTTSTIFHTAADDTGDLTVPRQAGELVAGEWVESLLAYQRFLVIGTSKGVRVATYSATGDLDIGPLIETGAPVYAMHPTASFVYFGWSNYDATTTGLGRINLERNTESEAFKPAYQSDLMYVGQGTVQGIADGANDAGDPGLFFTVSGVGVIRQTEDLVASGTYDSGLVRFGTLVAKTVTGVEVGHDALNGSVTVNLENDDGQEREVGTNDQSGTTVSDLFSGSLYGRGVKVQLTLTRHASDATLGPVVRWWALNALPAPPRSEEISLPLIWHREMDNLKTRKFYMDPLAELEYLEGLRDGGTMVAIQVGDKNYQGQVRRLAMEEGDATMMSERKAYGGGVHRRWFEGTLRVILVTKESS